MRILASHFTRQSFRLSLINNSESRERFTHISYTARNGSPITVTYCTSAEQLQVALEPFLEEDFVGFDCEWKPYDREKTETRIWSTYISHCRRNIPPLRESFKSRSILINSWQRPKPVAQKFADIDSELNALI